MRDWNDRKEGLARELFELRCYVSERAYANEDLKLLMAWVDDACLEEMDQLPEEHLTRISHELRTPLGNVKLYASLLQRGAPEKTARYIDVLHSEAERLQAEIENLLNLSRLEQGNTPLRCESIDLNHVALAAIVQHQPIAQHLSLSSELDSLPIWVRGDPSLTLQALLHLLHNAIKFTPHNGTIVVCTQNLSHEGSGQVSVQDSGPGIALDEQRHIFEPMYRGRAALEAGAPGAGLGLAISRQIVEQMGGRIVLESTLGAGSTFSVQLPAVEAQ